MPPRADDLFPAIANFRALTEAALRAARGKRRKPGVATFLAGLERNVLRLERALLDGSWRPGEYTVIEVNDPKPRRVRFARLRSPTHLEGESQKVEARVGGVHDVGLGLVEAEVQSAQHMAYHFQRLFHPLFAQHHDIVRVADKVRAQFLAQPVPLPDPIQEVQVSKKDHGFVRHSAYREWIAPPKNR